jgi:hypothetical protein
VLPAKGRQELEKLIARIRTLMANGSGGALQIGGVPEDYGGNHEAEPAGPVTLLVKAPVPDFTETVEEDCSCESIAGLAFVESRMNTATLVLHKKSPLSSTMSWQ